MTHLCKNKSPEEILKLAGFQYSSDAIRGWTRYPNWRPQKKDCVVQRANKNPVPKRRLHALITGNVIDLHLDTTEGSNHKSGKFGERVGRCIKEFEALDVA